MSEESVTVTLERISPFWAAVRTNVTLRVATVALGVLVAGISGWLSLKRDVADLQGDVAKLGEIITHQPDHAAEIAALKQQVSDLKEQVDEQKAKWIRVENGAEIKVVRRRQP